MAKDKKRKKMINNAIAEAVSVIYFADNSDYLTGLYSVLGELGGQELVDFVYSNPSKAFAMWKECGKKNDRHKKTSVTVVITG